MSLCLISLAINLASLVWLFVSTRLTMDFIARQKTERGLEIRKVEALEAQTKAIQDWTGTMKGAYKGAKNE